MRKHCVSSSCSSLSCHILDVGVDAGVTNAATLAAPKREIEQLPAGAASRSEQFSASSSAQQPLAAVSSNHQ